MLKWLGGSSSASSGGSNGVESLTHVGKAFKVNEYQVVVEELIAEGGFAVVYRTRSTRGQMYALKRMAVNNEQDLYLAKQEIAITKALSDCPYSVTFVGSSIQALSPDVHEVLILLELYTGPSVVHLLNARLAKKTTLSEHEVLKIFSSVVVAVGRLHHRTKPIIHRDLKIENILSDKMGNWILCDYGSCTVHSMHPETLGAAQCEDEIARFTTLSYRAPEMVSLYSGNTITTKADVWALGCLLYKLCFMSTPFGEQALAIVSAHFTVPEESPYSDQLHSLMSYMLEADPEKRPTIWQVSDVVCLMQGRPNRMPNVFRSPKPPVVLPRARRPKEDRTPPSRSNSDQSTPANSKPKLAATTLTTTSISSRERPRARVAGTVPSSTSTPSSAGGGGGGNSMAAPVVTRPHSSTPPGRRSHPSSRLEMPSIGRVQQLTVEPDLRALSKSWDSGLDMFGAVPFALPILEHHPTAMSQPSPNPPTFKDVRCDLFGSTPFSSPTPIQQKNAISNTSTPNPGVDDFGALPFVTCS